MATGIVFGAAPAFQATGGRLQESLREGGRGSAGERRAWLRNSLVVAQVALALILLIGSSLFIRSFLNLQGAAVGFDTAPMMTMRFYLPGRPTSPATPSRGASKTSCGASKRFLGFRRRSRRTSFRLAAADEATCSSKGSRSSRARSPASRYRRHAASAPDAWRRAPARPRLHRYRRRDEEPVALVNQTMAKRLWGDEDPVGRRFRLEGEQIRWTGSRSSASSPTSATIRGQRRRDRARGLRAVSVRADAQYRDHDPGRRRSCGDHRGGSRADPIVGSRAARVPDLDHGGSASAELLAVPPVRHHVLPVRRDRAGPRIDRRLRRAVVLGLAAHPGDRRAGRAWRGTRATCSG